MASEQRVRGCRDGDSQSMEKEKQMDQLTQSENGFERMKRMIGTAESVLMPTPAAPVCFPSQ